MSQASSTGCCPCRMLLQLRILVPERNLAGSCLARRSNQNSARITRCSALRRDRTGSNFRRRTCLRTSRPDRADNLEFQEGRIGLDRLQAESGR